MSSHLYICAEITVVPTADGGRRTPIFSGYWANWVFTPLPAAGQVGGQIEFEGQDTCAPGETCRIVCRRQIESAHWPDWITDGTPFTWQEGTYVVAKGVVLFIIRPEVKRG